MCHDDSSWNEEGVMRGGKKAVVSTRGDVRGTESTAIAMSSTVRATERAISQPVEVRNSTEGLEQ